MLQHQLVHYNALLVSLNYQHLDSLPWGELAGAQITPLGPLAGKVYAQRAWLHLTALH